MTMLEDATERGPLALGSSEGLGVAGAMLPCLSIRQPWAWNILNAGKNIENRDWPTKRRGRVLLHASKGMTRREYEDAREFAFFRAKTMGTPPFETLQRGGIVGSVEIVDCVEESASPWFVGRYGFLLRDPRRLPFVPWKGALGFFGVPRAALLAATPNDKGNRPA